MPHLLAFHRDGDQDTGNGSGDLRMLDFTGKVAFVTGAGSVGEGWGNGKATAVLLARRGALVCGLDLQAEALAGTTDILTDEGLADRWLPLACDMTDSHAVARAVADCLARFGRIDVLVNNVGGSAPGDPVSMSEEVWQAQLDLNLTTAFLGCKHVLPVMERQFDTAGKGGVIVNIGSVGSMTFQLGGRVSAGYAAAKAGLIGATKSLAKELAKRRITVNAVAPGLIDTEMIAAAPVEEIVKQIPMGRVGTAEEVAHLVAFLASDKASYITGQVIGINGGLA